jgi:hypothetical protein
MAVKDFFKKWGVPILIILTLLILLEWYVNVHHHIHFVKS